MHWDHATSDRLESRLQPGPRPFGPPEGGTPNQGSGQGRSFAVVPLYHDGVGQPICALNISLAVVVALAEGGVKEMPVRQPLAVAYPPGLRTKPEHNRSRKFAIIYRKNFRSRTIPAGIHAREGVASRKIGLGV